jgi:hypothetical protein
MSTHSRDGDPTDALTRALRDALPPPPVDGVDWPALQARVTGAAAPELAARAAAGRAQARAPRAPRAWWQPLAVWSPRGIPLAAAATAVLMIAAGAVRSGSGAVAADVNGFVTIEEELASGVAVGARSILAGLDADAMLDVALFYDGEDW